jgi:protein-disulfide isomerase
MDRRGFLAATGASSALAIVGAFPAFAQDTESGGIEIIEMVLGNPEANVEVVEYASYTCPHCANFHASVYPVLKSDFIDTGKIKFVYREVYFDRFGLWASMVARCGGEQRFFGLTKMFYEKQREWTAGGDPVAIAENLRSYGKVAGLSDETLDACLTDAEKAQALVDWFQKNTEEDGIKSTPSFVINGEKFEGSWDNDLIPAIEAALG